MTKAEAMEALTPIFREVFDDDRLFPCFGFGDATTSDKSVFPFYPDGHPCQGIDEEKTGLLLCGFSRILVLLKSGQEEIAASHA